MKKHKIQNFFLFDKYRYQEQRKSIKKKKIIKLAKKYNTKTDFVRLTAKKETILKQTKHKRRKNNRKTKTRLWRQNNQPYKMQQRKLLDKQRNRACRKRTCTNKKTKN